MSNIAFERKLNTDGSANLKYIDLLEEDKPISGQKFVCVSFVSPENILKQKDHFFFTEFLKHYDFSKSIKKYHQYLNFLSFKYNIKMDDLMSDFEEFVKTEKNELKNDTVLNEYKNFLDANEENLNDEFGKVHNFQTNNLMI